MRLGIGDDDIPIYRELNGRSTDAVPFDVKLFPNFDESKKQRRENGGCRSLLKILKEPYPGSIFKKNRTAVEWSGKPILRVFAPTADVDVGIQIIDRFFKTSPFDAEAIKKKFEEKKPQVVDEAEWQSL